MYLGTMPLKLATSGDRRSRDNRDAEGAELDGIWGGASSPQRLEDSGERRELPQRDPGNALWRILKATERSCLHLYMLML